MTPILLIDLFCGAGGVTSGMELATVNGEKSVKVIACVNHDPLAIQSHAANHPGVHHFTEDIKVMALDPLVKIQAKYTKMYPDSPTALWASLECTNFSKAKGGLPRDADSRTLANHLFRYITALNPSYIFIENVTEFMSWGRLDDNGKPVSRFEGEDFIKWRKAVKAMGYDCDHRVLNCADYGAYTSRERLFMIFARKGYPIAWPEKTHAKNPQKQTLFESLEKWKAVKEVLDFGDEGHSIFGRKKDLSEKTLERIYAGLIKYVAGGKDKFISKYYSGKPEYKNISLDGPAGTIKCIDGQALVKCCFIQKYNSTSVDGGCEHSVASIDKPSPTVATQVRMNLVQTFLSKNYSGPENHQSIDVPAGTVTTKDRFSLVKLHWLDKSFSGSSNHQSVDCPAGSILTNDHHAIINAERFIMDTAFNNIGHSVDEPSATITANRKHHYLVNPQYQSAGSSIENPCFTLIARMDKRAPSVVTVESKEVMIVVYDTDSPATVKIKEFMSMYGIMDIKMRMLRVDELKRITGFPDGYILKGNQADQKKFIGNAVPCIVPQRIAEALQTRLCEVKIKAA